MLVRGTRRAAAGVAALCVLGLLGCADRAPPARWQQPEPPSLARPLEPIATPEEAEGSTGPASEVEESAPAADFDGFVPAQGNGEARSSPGGMW